MLGGRELLILVVTGMAHLQACHELALLAISVNRPKMIGRKKVLNKPRGTLE